MRSAVLAGTLFVLIVAVTIVLARGMADRPVEAPRAAASAPPAGGSSPSPGRPQPLAAATSAALPVEEAHVRADIASLTDLQQNEQKIVQIIQAIARLPEESRQVALMTELHKRLADLGAFDQPR
ncbi:MAG: hypothetical protein Q8R78_04760 [Candidatus Omnitrophota bacterium]|nr:hypothetical protein [Candidatus Omnitrophota bacterium]